jgi:hypothetical protein
MIEPTEGQRRCQNSPLGIVLKEYIDSESNEGESNVHRLNCEGSVEITAPEISGGNKSG